jgi:hypothetical protein
LGGLIGGNSFDGGGLVGLMGCCGGEYATVVDKVVLVVAGVRLVGITLLVEIAAK